MVTDNRRTLVDFLVRKAFDPVMHARPDGRSEAEQKKLDHVRDATRKEIERYRGYASAREVVTNFRRDLHSRAAKKVHAELKSLHLPTLDDIREEFEAKVQELGVKGRS
jgi:transcriptional regulator of NAD metabolism